MHIRPMQNKTFFGGFLRKILLVNFHSHKLVIPKIGRFLQSNITNPPNPFALIYINKDLLTEIFINLIWVIATSIPWIVTNTDLAMINRLSILSVLNPSKLNIENLKPKNKLYTQETFVLLVFNKVIGLLRFSMKVLLFSSDTKKFRFKTIKLFCPEIKFCLIRLKTISFWS